MAGFTVTFEQLKTQAENLNQLNESFHANVNELESMEAQLGGMWEGAAKDAFHTAFTNDKIQMDNFHNAIAAYVQRLMEIASKYLEAENINVETAMTRNYK